MAWALGTTVRIAGFFLLLCVVGAEASAQSLNSQLGALNSQLGFAQSADSQLAGGLPSDFHWTTDGPLVEPHDVAGITVYSIKDPSVVFHEGRWHLFCTIRGKERTHAVVSLHFEEWAKANEAPWQLLTMHEGYYCAPEVFYYRPHEKWYMICQAAKDEWEPHYQPAFSTTTTLDDPDSWTPLETLYDGKPDNLQGWIDFWVICDDDFAHLFFTSNDGNMWHSKAAHAEFPKGWSRPGKVLETEIFEASHTYKVQDQSLYLTIVEADDGDPWRYYKAYTATSLDGPWAPLAVDRDHAFAALNNVEQPVTHWTDNISHGELLRSGYDETLEIDPANLRFLIQGVLEPDRRGKEYGEIPWKLGILRSVEP